MESKRLDYNWNIKENILSKGIITNGSEDILDEEFRRFHKKDISKARQLKSVQVNGFLYNSEIFLILLDNLDKWEKSIGKVCGIFLTENKVVFKLVLYDIVGYFENINCFRLVETNEKSFKYLNDIVHKQPVNSYTPLIYSKHFDKPYTLITIRNFFHNFNRLLLDS